MKRLPNRSLALNPPHVQERKIAVSYGISMRTKTWTGYGKDVPDLGYSDDVMPNIESPEFIESLTAESENEGAE